MNKIKQYIKISLMIILTTILVIYLFPVSVYATDLGEVAGNIDYEGNYADDETYKNKTSPKSSKWYATYGEDTGYKGQGVLIYMLTNEGEAVTDVNGNKIGAKAFPCEMGVENITLNARDKYGIYAPVTTWTVADVPWASVTGYNGRMMIDTTKVNTGAIKEWLLTEVDTINGEKSRNGIWLVEKLWGTKIAERFVNKEIVLVVEPIVAVQYAKRASIINTLTLRS